MLNINTLRQDFPILQKKINNHPLAYFDNAATTQKPKEVIEAITRYYTHDNANAYRSVHSLSEQTTLLIEQARYQVQTFIGAKFSHECIWTKGATEAINLIASGFSSFLLKGDHIAVTVMEHHANFVPWQQLCLQREANLLVLPIRDTYTLDVDSFASLLSQKNIKLLAITHISNTLGTITPLKELIKLAHTYGIIVLVDGSQAGAHLQINVQDLDCDFYVLSAHKMFGPTGIGILYGKEKYLDLLPPYQTGGHMVSSVTHKHTTFNTLPYKFEAGTLPIASIVGFTATLNYLNKISYSAIQQHEELLRQQLLAILQQFDNIKIISPLTNSIPLISFTMDNFHPHDIGTILNSVGIAIRAGHHCTLPLLEFLQIPATARISLAFYNTCEEISLLFPALLKVQKILSPK